jgi:hypothetical protein
MKLADLARPFPPERVSWRVGSTTQDKKRGMALAYIDARDVMDRLDEVCGPEGWSCRYPATSGKAVLCEIAIKIGGEWVGKEDGAGDTDVEAEKGALSDAFKRAAVKWGVGRYLYDLDSPWVELEAAGKSYKIPDRERARLQAILQGKAPPQAHAPDAVNSAARYMATAMDTISVAPGQEALQRWWKAESENRRSAGLTQADVDALKVAMQERLGELVNA